MRVIFLDVDGVLNNLNFLYEQFRRSNIPNIKGLDNNNLKALQKLVELTDAKLILSSTWRSYFDDNLKPLNNDHNPGKDLIKKLNEYNLKLTGKTSETLEYKGFPRSYVIKKWLDEHPEVDSFVIIDDNAIMGEFTYTNLVEVDKTVGLTMNDVIKAVTILKRQEKRKVLEY